MLSDSERALARAVLIHGPISRSELTSRLGLSPPSLTRLAKPFLDRGLLRRARRPVGRVGRPPRPAARRRGRVWPASRASSSPATPLYVVATDVRAAAPRLRGAPARAPRPGAASPPRSHAPSAGSGVDRHRGRRGVARRSRPATAAWSSPRSSTGRTCRSRSSSRPSWASPSSLENDLVALAEAERWFGAGPRHPRVRRHHHRRRHRVRARGQRRRSCTRARRASASAVTSRSAPPVRVCHAGHRGCAEAMLTSGSIAAQVLGGPAAPGRLRRGAASRGGGRPGRDDGRRRGRGRASDGSSRSRST